MAGAKGPPPRLVATIRRIYRKSREIASQEIINTFGQAWRGGKFDASYLTGRIPFSVLPDQHDTVTISIPGSSDATTHGDYGTLPITFPNAYASTTLASGASGGTNSLHVASLAGFAITQKVTVTQVSGGTASEKLIISGIDTTTKVLTTTTALTNAYSTGDTVQVIPDITPGSSDMGWIPSYDNVTPTGFDLSLARRVSLYAAQLGTKGGTIASGTDHVDIFVGTSDGFPVYQTTPVPAAVAEATTHPADRFGVQVFGNPTTTGVTFRVTYISDTPGGTISKSPTGITVDAGGAESLSSGGPNSNITSDPLTRTDPTWGAETATTSTVTGVATTGAGNLHTHAVTTAPGTTGNASGAHTHPVPDHSHVHHHAHDLGAHTHGVDTLDHTHGITEPNGGAGHDHTFLGAAQNAPHDADFTLHWTSQGLRFAAALTKDASWVAKGS